MKTKSTIALAVASALCFSACNSTKQATLSDLKGEWNIIAVNGDAITPSDNQEQPYIGFDTSNGNVFGNAGCNNIMGHIDPKAAAGIIDLSNMASTRMACPDMATEQNIMSALSQVTAYKASNNGNIYLCDASGSTVITLEKRPNSISPEQLTGTWRINEIGGTDLSADSTATYTLTFDPTEHRFAAATGCNTLSGQYSGEYIDIAFSGMISTMMECPDMTVEQAISTTLPQITWFEELQEGRMGFYNSLNDLVMVLEKE